MILVFPKDGKMNHIYTHKLGDIKPGRLFAMVNYNGAFMRVKAENLMAQRSAAMGVITYDFNDDGNHVPVVKIETGQLFYMAKEKPCYLFPGGRGR